MKNFGEISINQSEKPRSSDEEVMIDDLGRPGGEIVKKPSKIDTVSEKSSFDNIVIKEGEKYKDFGSAVDNSQELLSKVDLSDGDIDSVVKKENLEKELEKPISGDMISMVDDINRYNESNKSKEYPEKSLDNIGENLEKEISIFKEFRVSIEELKNIEGFEKLSHGQRLSVAENLKQLTLGRVHEEASGQYKKDTMNVRFLGRVWKSISKKYQIAKLEKVTAKDIVSGGIDVHGETLTQLIKRAIDGPDIEVEQDGSLKALYVSGMENLASEQKKKAESFNQIASEFSKIPEEWRFETASRKEQEEYQKLRERYEKAKISIFDIKEGKTGNQEAMLYMNNIDARVYGDQFLNTHPDVEKQLQNITNKSIWTRAMKDVVTERGIYSVAGFLTRSVTTSLFGLTAVPFAAAGIGGFMSRKRAKETLVEREIDMRRGLEDKSEEAKNFVNSEQLREKLDKLNQRINIEEDSNKREKLLTSLKARINYTRDKIEDGLVNYGKGEKRLVSQYELISSLGASAVGAELNMIEKSKLEKRLDDFLSFKEEKISKTQKKYLRNQMVRGAVMGAGFAVTGYVLRHFGEEWFGSDEVGSKNSLDDVDDASDGATEKVKAMASQDMEKSNTAVDNTSDDAREKIKEMVSQDTELSSKIEIPESIIVKPGDSIWKISERWLTENGKLEGLNPEQKTYVIDSLKDKLVNGTDNPDLIKVGQEIDFGDKFEVSDVEKAINSAKGLSAEQIENIKNYEPVRVNAVEVSGGEIGGAGGVEEISKFITGYPEGVEVSIGEDAQKLMKSQGIRFENGKLILGNSGKFLNFDSESLSDKGLTENINIAMNGDNLEITVIDTDDSIDHLIINPSNEIISSEGVELLRQSGVEAVAETSNNLTENMNNIFGNPSPESITDSVKSVFGNDFLGKTSEIVTRGDGVKVIKNLYGHKGFDLLLTKDKIGIDGPALFNWGTKSSLFGFGDSIPTVDLDDKSVGGVKKFVEESLRQMKENLENK